MSEKWEMGERLKRGAANNGGAASHGDAGKAEDGSLGAVAFCGEEKTEQPGVGLGAKAG